MSDRVYIFLDESGNLDFSAKGTRYFVLTSVSMERPFQIDAALDDYRYHCIEGGADIEHFHCYNDRRAIRSAVFDRIAAHADGMRVDCLVVEKGGVRWEMRDGARFYAAVMGHLLRLALRMEGGTGNAKDVIVITDTVPVNSRRRAVQKAIRTTLAGALPGFGYRLLHHQSRSHYGLQVADYCSWAVFRKWQRGERLWYDRIEPAMRSELRIGGDELVP